MTEEVTGSLPNMANKAGQALRRLVLKLPVP